MDSLTQIILGAAAGEVVLGKKIGNRAMLWGAVGGTIPDLDVLGGLFLSNIDNVAFHRGISHSIFFSIVGALLFGWLVHLIYKNPHHKWIAVAGKTVAAILVISALQFLFTRFFPGNYVPLGIVGLITGLILYFNVKKRYFNNQWKAPTASIRDWQWLFFWSLITHPLLDCFTMYGTQLFAPFSNVRVAWSTISVADPMYTVPFLICLIIASRYRDNLNKRKFWNYLGIGLSSAYMLFTVFNKQRVNNVFSTALKKQNVPVERFITNASILNNILWNCTAETKDHYYLAQYSLFDKGDVVFSKIKKNHEMLQGLDTDRTLQTLKWFSDGYFTINELESGFQLSDLRFGTFSGKGKGPDDFLFRFKLREISEGNYYLEEAAGGPPEGQAKDLMPRLWKRMKGI
ncbi:MAG: metal-dependent hydrolase [Bacteroidetes bacterium]|nr:MAG: metal-dependent hydrolase [Bacteroidota bacterium]